MVWVENGELFFFGVERDVVLSSPIVYELLALFQFAVDIVVWGGRIEKLENGEVVGVFCVGEVVVSQWGVNVVEEDVPEAQTKDRALENNVREKEKGSEKVPWTRTVAVRVVR